jgi:hypothetical protein
MNKRRQDTFVDILAAAEHYIFAPFNILRQVATMCRFLPSTIGLS